VSVRPSVCPVDRQQQQQQQQQPAGLLLKSGRGQQISIDSCVTCRPRKFWSECKIIIIIIIILFAQ